MATQSEAACLLETGAMYGRRLLLRPGAGDPVFAGFRPGVFSLYFGDAPIYHVDREGRWQRAFDSGMHYLKGLDATVQAIDRVRRGENLVLKRRTLGYAEASDLDAQVRAAAIDVLEALNAGRLATEPPPPPTPPLDLDELRDILERVAGWDAAAWFAHRERYLDAYGPLPILPPDAQGAVVLQATLGHAGGVAFGRGATAEHAPRTPGEFAAHAESVRRLLGRRLAQCRGLFLAGADALRQGPDTVAAYLDAIAVTFPISPGPRPARTRGIAGLAVDDEPHLDGVAAFLDDLAPPRPGPDDWHRFRDRHLRRVSLGIESGDPDVRAFYRKTWTDDDARSLVADLKDAGIGVGVLVLADAGGVKNARRHLEATAALINSLPLGPGDLVSILDGEEVRDPGLAPDDLGFTPLDAPRRAGQQAELRRLLDPARTGRGAKVAPYSLEKQSSQGV